MFLWSVSQGLETRLSTEESEVRKYVVHRWDAGGFGEPEENNGMVFGESLSAVNVKTNKPEPTYNIIVCPWLFLYKDDYFA